MHKKLALSDKICFILYFRWLAQINNFIVSHGTKPNNDLTNQKYRFQYDICHIFSLCRHNKQTNKKSTKIKKKKNHHIHSQCYIFQLNWSNCIFPHKCFWLLYSLKVKLQFHFIAVRWQTATERNWTKYSTHWNGTKK